MELLWAHPVTSVVSRKVSSVVSPSATDIELVRLHKAGERDAYALIVQRYQDMVFSLCLRWMGRDRSVAEEVAQDVFVALYRSLDKFRGDA